MIKSEKVYIPYVVKCASEKGRRSKHDPTSHPSRIPDPAHHPSRKASLLQKVGRVMQILRFPKYSAPVSYGQQEKHSLQNQMNKRSYAATLLFLYAPKPKRVGMSILKIFMTLSVISSWELVVGSMSNLTSRMSRRLWKNDLRSFQWRDGGNMRSILSTNVISLFWSYRNGAIEGKRSPEKTWSHVELEFYLVVTHLGWYKI